jgi:hypothetical protein
MSTTPNRENVDFGSGQEKEMASSFLDALIPCGNYLLATLGANGSPTTTVGLTLSMSNLTFQLN